MQVSGTGQSGTIPWISIPLAATASRAASACSPGTCTQAPQSELRCRGTGIIRQGTPRATNRLSMCTAWLVEHRFRHRLNCHHCGFSMPLPSKCPKCGEADSLVACGPGVERIDEEVRERFPEARIALLSSDLIPSLTEMRDIIHRIEGAPAGEADGTDGADGDRLSRHRRAAAIAVALQHLTHRR